MQQSPWRTYFGQMHKNSSREERIRHPIVVAVTVVSLLGIIATALILRFYQWYHGEISVLTLCIDKRYNLSRDRAIVPINEPLAYSLSLAATPVIVLCIELLYLIMSLDENERRVGDVNEPRLSEGLYFLLFRFIHFTAVLILTAAFVSVLVDTTKIVFNWPRPYFLTEFAFNCDPSFVLNNPGRTLSPEEINARLGFPSYRMALLSAAAILLSVHSIRTLRAMLSSGPFQAFVVIASVLAPLLAAASVLNSHENRPEDVVVGLLIGVISATYMTSMLPTKLIWHDSATETLTSIPTTIEELNSFVPMRQPLAFNFAPAGLRRTASVHQRQAAAPAASTSQPVPLPGLTTSAGGITRAN